jgi:hypothetical protein
MNKKQYFKSTSRYKQVSLTDHGKKGSSMIKILKDNTQPNKLYLLSQDPRYMCLGCGNDIAVDLNSEDIMLKCPVCDKDKK